MNKLCNNEISYYVTNDVPQSALDISEDKKVDVLVSLVTSLRADHISWIDRSYTAATWSIGLLVTAMSYVVVEKAGIKPNGIFIIAAGMFLFGLTAQLFFCAARNAHHGIGAAISRCEASLKLCTAGSYITSAPFFGYSGKWVPPTHITILQIIHLLTLILSVLIVATCKSW